MFRKLVYLVFASILFAVTFWFGFTWTLHTGRTRVPDLVGIPLDRAEQALKEIGLVLVLDTGLATPSDSIPGGAVAAQDPKGGRQAVRGSEVRVGLSLGLQQIAVPDLKGKNVQEAKFILMKQQLRIDSIAQMPFPGDPGRIIAHFPSEGTLVSRDTPVQILVASPTPVQAYVMPNCLGKNLEPVRRAFEIRGITISGVREKSMEAYPEGIILHQFPLPGHPVRPGDVVSFTVNTGGSNG
ncbi:MAG TPA: PASTA domain-containing protein [Thermoanaerobaculia bacterium]|nr:PASTA domain-containing protein [Thermoanaerobaculia bacterium]HUM29108.1 PASTA domain-containing protein [Thermoanaerobaculia bacterium]HXK67485.1 PASTA domain-containing protein [Thermoanaerobaculia bacterium]